MVNNKTDSNLTALRYTEEAALRTLPANPVWYSLEPNTYSDYGSQVTLVARNPINSSRQQKKGVITDLDASGGFNQDLTFSNTTRLLQGFFFADIRELPTTTPLNGSAAIAVQDFKSGVLTLASNPGFAVNDMVLVQGFTNGVNNSSAIVTKVDGNTITLSPNVAWVDEAPTAAVSVQKVGIGVNGNVAQSGGLYTLSLDGVDFTKQNLIPGCWVFLGGWGFARVSVVSAGQLTFDKVVASNPAAPFVGLFLGNILKNEDDSSLIKRRTYQVERELGNDGNGVMSEYLVGAVPNEFTLNVSQASKVTADLTFVALDNEQRTGAQGLKAGTRLSISPEDAFNTSTDISHIGLSQVDPSNAVVTPLFAFASEMKLTLNNNVTVNKAIGVLGGFDTSAGIFEVSGSQTVYFGSVEAVQAVRNNADVSFEMIIKKGNQGIVFDMPLLSLSDGRLSVTANQAITLPLTLNAAESKYTHTLLYQAFPYLPD